MNINTNTLLNNLISKVDSTIKANIEKLSMNTKVDLNTSSKDKGIQTLLTSLFKDISTGVKGKNEVATLLDNSKQSLKFKNISTDVKQIINSINVELKNNPEVKPLVSSLITSLVDIKNLDEKILKSVFQNNGIFLESKISKSTISVSSNLEKLIDKLNTNLKILTSLDTTSKNNSNILENKIKPEGTNVKFNLISQKVLTLSAEHAPNNKAEIHDVVKKIESTYSSLDDSSKLEKKFTSLNEVTMQMQKLELKAVTPTIKNELVLNLKELIQQAKNNLLNNSSLNINKAIVLISEQIENIQSDNMDEIKLEIKKLDSQLKVLNNEKNPEGKTLLNKEIILETKKIIDTIKNSNIPDLLKSNINNMKNVSNDVKTIMLQLKEIIEQPNNSDTISKELKNTVDKVLSQIDYYQLSSVASNSSHGYLSFVQDDLNDVDIKFNKQNKDEFSCLIHLSLKEKGDLKILLQLDNNKSLNITIGVEQDVFKEKIQNSLQKLRLQINSLGLSISSLNVFDLNEDLQKSNELKAYENNSNIDFGVDIKV